MPKFVHPSAIIEPGAHIGDDARIWHFCHVRSGARIGDATQLGMSVYIDDGVVIGSRCRIQNHVSVYSGVTLANDVFVGPSAVFTNDLFPRAHNDQWLLTPTFVQEGASIGANCTIRCGVTIGEWSMVGAGSVVTRDVQPFSIVVGSPSHLVGWVCKCGKRMTGKPDGQCLHNHD